MSTQPARRKTADTQALLPASQPLPTRPQRSASSQNPNVSTTARIELLQDSRSNIKDHDAAQKWLIEKELIIEGESTTTASLTMALLYLASGKFSIEQLINGIRAVAICLESIPAPNHASADPTSFTDRIIDSLQERLAVIEKKVDNCTAKVLTPSPTPIGFPPLGSTSAPTTYAAALANGSSPPSRLHHEILLRAEIQTRQILLDNPKDSKGAASNLSEKELTAKANLAIELMGNDALTLRPLQCKVITATILRNKGVILEFSNPEGADWVRDPDNAHLFEDCFGGSVTIKPRSYPIIVEFLPTSLASSLVDSLREIEDTNSMTTNSIVSVRWMKQPKNWKIGQRSAHAIFTLKSADIANTILRDGFIIEGTRLRARKLEDDPQRCFKCQHYGHSAIKCNNNFDTCATCAESHPSSECATSRRDKFSCAPCRTNNLPGRHAAWDSSCPVRIEEKKKLLTKRPEGNYRYFVTNEAWTWAKYDSSSDENSNNTTRWRGTTNENRQQERPARQEHEEARDSGWGGTLGTASLTDFLVPRRPSSSHRRTPTNRSAQIETTDQPTSIPTDGAPSASQPAPSTRRPTPGRPRSMTVGTSTQRSRSASSRRHDPRLEPGQRAISSFFSEQPRESQNNTLPE